MNHKGHRGHRGTLLGVLAVIVGVALLSPSIAPGQDLTAIDEMRLQADRLYEQDRFCAAAQRYRAIVGDRPELFRRYAEARAACLAADESD